jgi:hypothetical protein
MTFSHIAGRGLAAVATSWTTYALAAGGLCSLLLTQTAYQAARPMITLPVIAVCTPLASAAVGVGLLGERVRADGPRGAIAVLAVLVATGGLIGVARTAAARESHLRPPGGGRGPCYPVPAIRPDREAGDAGEDRSGRAGPLFPELVSAGQPGRPGHALTLGGPARPRE